MSANVRARQASAIAELLNPLNRNYADVAAKCGVNERQIRRWLDDADFQQELAQARQALLERTLDRLAGANVYAIDALLETLSKAHPQALRRLAANDILNHHTKLVDLVDLQQRISAMEAALYEK